MPNPPAVDSRRVLFQITEKGMAVFDAWLAAPAGARLGVYEDELSTRVTFLRQADPPLRSRLLAWWRDELRKQTRAVEHARETAVTQTQHDPDARCRALELSRRLRHLIADLEFLDEVGADANGPPRAPTVPGSRPIAPRIGTRTPAYGAEASRPGTSRRDRRRPSSASPRLQV